MKDSAGNLTPVSAMRARCLGCAESRGAVRECVHEECPLWPYRLGRRPNEADGTIPHSVAVLTPRVSIRAYCLFCQAGSRTEVKGCHLCECPLHPHRSGKRQTEADRTPELAARF